MPYFILYRKLYQTFQTNFDRYINSFKTAFAVLIGLTIAWFLNLPSNQWLVITILVVMCGQTNLGGTLNKAYMRILGTLIGAVIAGATLFIFDNNYFAVISVIVLSSLVFSYIAAGSGNVSYAGTLGAVTVAIILFSPEPTLETAVIRTFEIILGALIAMMVANFVFPIRARIRLRHNIANNLREMCKLYEIGICSFKGAENLLQEQDIEEGIIQRFSAQKKLIEEASREPRKFNQNKFINITRSERKIFRNILLMNHSIKDLRDTSNFLAKLQKLDSLNKEIVAALNTLADMAVTHKPLIRHVDTAIKASLESITAEIVELTHQSALVQVMSIHAFLVCAKNLVIEIQVIENLFVML